MEHYDSMSKCSSGINEKCSITNSKRDVEACKTVMTDFRDEIESCLKYTSSIGCSCWADVAARIYNVTKCKDEGM